MTLQATREPVLLQHHQETKAARVQAGMGRFARRDGQSVRLGFA